MVMGIYDREYYRRDGPSFLSSLTDRSRGCVWLIGITVACFIIQVAFKSPEDGGSPFTEALDLKPTLVLHGEIWRLLTYAFLHDPFNLWHILINMLVLWWFGTVVEDLYGTKEFVLVYLTAALVGGLAYTLAGELELLGAKPWVPCVGASGAVMAIMVLCALHFPYRRVFIFPLPISLPLWLLATLYIGWDLFSFLSGRHTNVAVTAHLGGALFGLLYYNRHWRLLGLWSALTSWQRQLFRPRLRVYHEEPRQPVTVAAPPTPAADLDEQLEAKLDAVLEKVARHGQSSLTDNERQILIRASEVYKRRRT
jgi:membrane associated rhomboid family serine protease